MCENGMSFLLRSYSLQPKYKCTPFCKALGYSLYCKQCISRVCEFTGLECENGVLEWNTGVEYWSIQTEFLDANIANQDTHQV